MKPRELLALVALAAAWGASFLFIRIAAPAVGPFPMAAGRVLLAAVLLGLGLQAARRPVPLRGRAGALLVLGLLNAALPFALIGWAELHLSASLTALLNATVPLWSALLAARYLGDPITRRRAGGLLLGVLGVVAIVGWSPIALTGTTLLAVAAVIVSCAAYAAAGVWTKLRLQGVPGPALALGQQLGALAWLALPALLAAPAARPTRAAVLAVLALGVLCTTLAYLLFFYLLERVGPTRTTTVTYVIPVFGVLWGRLFLGEPITLGMAVGLGLIVGSVVLVNGVRLRWPGRVSRGALAR